MSGILIEKGLCDFSGRYAPLFKIPLVFPLFLRGSHSKSDQYTNNYSVNTVIFQDNNIALIELPLLRKGEHKGDL